MQLPPEWYPVAVHADELIEGEPIDLTGDGALLDAGRPYLIRLQESRDLPFGRACPGQLEELYRARRCVHACDHGRGHTFDDIRAGYSGDLWLEVVPLSFAVRVREGLTLNQLRLSTGSHAMSDRTVADLHREVPLLYRGGGVVNDKHFAVSNGLFLGLNLKGDRSGFVGYVARDTTRSEPRPSSGRARPMWTCTGNGCNKETDGDQIVLAPRGGSTC